MDEFEPHLSIDDCKNDVLRMLGTVASNADFLLPWPSVYCIYDTFDPTDETDENYASAVSFCDTVRREMPQYSDYANKIWAIFLEKRAAFEPYYHTLPQASFQSDLSYSNVLVDGTKQFAGVLDFNLSGTICVLAMLVLPEACGFNLLLSDLERLGTQAFRDECDARVRENLRAVARHYAFTDIEREAFSLCWNTIFPFCYYMIHGLLAHAIKAQNAERVGAVLDWVLHQLTRNDLALPAASF